MASVLGLEAKIYRNTGNYASPTWVELTNVKDVTLTLEKDFADTSTRAANGWKTGRATLKNAKVDFSMLWDTSDAGFTAISGAFFNNTTIEFAVLSGASNTNGSQGLRATMDVVNFSRKEPLNEALTVDVSLQPAPSNNAPSWMTV